MGQSHSAAQQPANDMAADDAPDSPSRVVSDRLASALQDLRKQANILADLNKLTYEEFRQSLDELNSITRFIPDHRVVFVVLGKSDSTPVWKATVRIGCARLSRPSNKVEMWQELSLSQFVRLYRTFQTHLSALSDGQRANLLRRTRAGDLPAAPRRSSGQTGASNDDGAVCLICMDRCVDMSLSCAHNFCTPCIEQWRQLNATCPLCMHVIGATENGEGDTWVLTERPEAYEVCDLMLRDLLDITERTPE